MKRAWDLAEPGTERTTLFAAKVLQDGSTRILAAQDLPPHGERCKDFDDECPEVTNKLECWLHAPELGVCPYLTGELPE